MQSGLIGRAGLWVGLVLVWIGLLPGTGAAAPQGEALLKTDLLGVFAHPDDETGVAPLMAYYALGAGKRVSHVYCTRGEGGGNMVGRQGGMALGILRERTGGLAAPIALHALFNAANVAIALA
jgi:hypothetical protein